MRNHGVLHLIVPYLLESVISVVSAGDITTLFVYPTGVHGERELSDCDPHAACNVVYKRIGYPTKVQRFCRCRPPDECESQWEKEPGEKTLVVENRSQLKFCRNLSTMKNCSSGEKAINVAEEFRDISSKVMDQTVESSDTYTPPKRIIAYCRCPQLHYVRLSSTTENKFICSKLKARKEGEVCGYVRTDIFATGYIGTCASGQQCLAKDKTTHQRRLLLYQGPVYTARCTSIAN